MYWPRQKAPRRLRAALTDRDGMVSPGDGPPGETRKHHSLIATPLKPATPMALEVADQCRSP
jgi:hypothetical protein